MTPKYRLMQALLACYNAFTPADQTQCASSLRQCLNALLPDQSSAASDESKAAKDNSGKEVKK